MVGPLIRRLRLMQELFRMGAMAEQRNGGDEDGENRHRYRDGRHAGVVRALLGLLLQFLKFVRHSFPPSNMQFALRKRIPESAGAHYQPTTVRWSDSGTIAT